MHGQIMLNECIWAEFRVIPVLSLVGVGVEEELDWIGASLCLVGEKRAE